jgi:hypothetical protein
MDIQRVVVELSETEHRVLDPGDVYFLAGAGGRTEVRLRGREPLVDVRELQEVPVTLFSYCAPVVRLQSSVVS